VVKESGGCDPGNPFPYIDERGSTPGCPASKRGNE
jgi:hypothetical protein